MSTPTPQSSIVHSESEVLYADEMFIRLIGAASPDEVIGRPLTDFLESEYDEPLRRQVENLKDGRKTTQGLYLTLQTVSGHRCDIVALSSPIEWEGTTQVQTSFLHITGERSQSGVSLRDYAMDQAPVGITIADATRPDMPLVYVNGQFINQTGYARSEALDRNCRFLQGDRTRDEPVRKMREAIASEEPVTVELRNYRKDGSMFWNRVGLVPITSESGDVTHYLGFQQDITNTKLYEREKSVFEKQAEVADQAMFVTDRDGTIEYVNPAFEASTGYSAPEAIGQTPQILKSGRQDESVYKDLWDTITSGELWEGELTNETKAGILYQVELTIVPITDDTGTITHFAAIEQDVTDKLLREQTLNVLNRILRHNLRTAITVIEGQTDILESNLENTDPRMVIETIQNQTESMRKIADKTAMIRTLWEQNREGKAWNRSYIESLVQQYCKQYPQAEITLTIDISDEVQLPNAELFELSFDEAIENAVTHAEQTTPEIEITVTQKETSKRAVITVADNGPGIPENERETLEAGKEVPLAHGTGIGLWIMEWVTTNLGGEFVIEDNTPQGTLLSFDLPIVTHTESTAVEDSFER